MHDQDEVCLCFHVTKGKIASYLKRENPPVASLLSECLGAGTGCGWCIPFLKHMHERHVQGLNPDLELDVAKYADERLAYHKTGERPGESA